MTDEEKAKSVHHCLKLLRSKGWMVAVHNDYMLNGKLHTFWLCTSTKGPYFAKGESTEYMYALNQVLDQIESIERWAK